MNELIDTLTKSRGTFQEKILSLTKEMNDAQTSHHRDMIKMTQYNQTLTESLAEKTMLVEDLKKEKFEAMNKKKKMNLVRNRTDLDIDDDEEFFYAQAMTTDRKTSMDKSVKRTRSFKPEQYNTQSNGYDVSSMENTMSGRSRNMNSAGGGHNYANNVSHGTSNSKLQKMYQRAQKNKSHGQRSRYTHKNGY